MAQFLIYNNSTSMYVEWPALQNIPPVQYHALILCSFFDDRTLCVEPSLKAEGTDKASLAPAIAELVALKTEFEKAAGAPFDPPKNVKAKKLQNQDANKGGAKVRAVLHEMHILRCGGGGGREERYS